ncbi:hypothetical protein [Aurantibacillus circumpalustris]|uniref:hypothetical protein n=1 Tax=Aurantibacillus circumpalustris TaxID=3036359 RepID=UPI00295B56AA|nr:hypothetical protein [Aurantibacillus circumpalustris]
MKKKMIVEKYKAKTHEYLLALFFFPSAVKLIKPKDRLQESIVNWFLDKEKYVPDESYDLPTIKALGEELGMSSGVIRHQLEQLYEQICDLNFDQPFLFKKEKEILCHIVFRYQGNDAAFTVGLTHIPHVGGSFNFFFIKPKIGTSSFWIKRIYHEYDDGGQKVTMILSSDYPNAYLNLVRDKAFLKREISFGELIRAEIDSELRDKLLNTGTGSL